MKKLDCNSFRITGNTNFKKKLASFVSKSVWGNPAMKVKHVKVATEIRACLHGVVDPGLVGLVSFVFTLWGTQNKRNLPH